MSRPTQHRFARFVMVGGTATIIQYLVLMALVTWAHLEPWVSSDIGFTLSSVYNYFMNRCFTFASHQSHLVAGSRFALLVALGVTTNTVIMKALTQLGLYYLTSQIIASVVVLIVNFSVANYWVFAEHDTGRP